jgi:hypothetical protein
MIPQELRDKQNPLAFSSLLDLRQDEWLEVFANRFMATT